MSDVVISVEGLSKRYRLGQIGATSLRESAEHWWHKIRGRNPRDHMGEVGQGQQATKAKSSGADLNDLNDLNDSKYVWALRDVSFEVKKGEVLGIIGKNGAGKSTLLKILSRITEPTSGRAVMRGRVGSLLEVGTGFHPELTGRENIFLNGAILGMKKREVAARFDEIVAFAEVEKFIDTPVKRYSSGMYVRLAFAVAAHLDPEILVVDEVLAVGDASFQKRCLGKMGDIARGGRTILFVSHNMAAVKELCGEAILLDVGQIVSDGEASVVVEGYLRGKSTEGHVRIEDGTSGISLKRALTHNGDFDPKNNFFSEENIYISLEVEVKEKGLTGSRVGIHLRSAEDVILFSSGVEAGNRNAWPEGLSIGVYLLTLKLPANLLNTGEFYLSVASDIHMRHIFFHCRDLLRFSVIRTKLTEGDVNAHRYGKLLVDFPWEAKALGVCNAKFLKALSAGHLR